MSDGLVAVWDANDKLFWCGGIWKMARQWLYDQGIPVDDTYRVEVYLIDVPFARVFTYKLGPAGERRYNLATDQVDTNEPYDRVVTELPPEDSRLILSPGSLRDDRKLQLP